MTLCEPTVGLARLRLRSTCSVAIGVISEGFLR
jgi:hypothetical protein